MPHNFLGPDPSEVPAVALADVDIAGSRGRGPRTGQKAERCRDPTRRRLVSYRSISLKSGFCGRAGSSSCSDCGSMYWGSGPLAWARVTFLGVWCKLGVVGLLLRLVARSVRQILVECRAIHSLLL
ncbi:hypothetical protein HD806DRAFT_533194 [Xylariaceae sp. AK1471]|nr:hypothetical protein HD806DRAFT_533194 [Xylariaceae sp. AK1471]